MISKLNFTSLLFILALIFKFHVAAPCGYFTPLLIAIDQSASDISFRIGIGTYYAAGDHSNDLIWVLLNTLLQHSRFTCLLMGFHITCRIWCHSLLQLCCARCCLGLNDFSTLLTYFSVNSFYPYVLHLQS